jgi:dTDP-L-rhamnose 4-epimerase
MTDVLITGVAGFIGMHLAKALVTRGMRVRVLDALIAQTHPGGKVPPDLAAAVDFVHGDVSEPEVWRQALAGIDVVFHLAAGRALDV